MTPDEVREMVEVKQNLASLNDVVIELVIAQANGDPVSKGWAYSVTLALGEHSRKLGYEPQLTVADIAHWENEE